MNGGFGHDPSKRPNLFPSMNLVSSDHPALWTVAAPVTDVPSVTERARAMFRIMAANHGVGLAAPQVGISERFFIMQDGLSILACINPEIINHGRDAEEKPEGCLSFPNQQVVKKRWRVITLRYTDETGRLRERVFKGLAARVAQHELDHLDGINIISKS